MTMARLLTDRRGAAAAEMALVAPLLIALLFGVTDLGRYFWSQHILVKSVRDGAVYASRQQIGNFDCANDVVDPGVVSETRELVETGQLSGGSDLLPNWSSGSTIFTIALDCVTESDGTTLGGIYTANAGQVPVITVTASVPYTSMVGLRSGLSLNASQQSTVYGI
jgi:hypothetical protein